jgi:hypothetical protein
VPFKRKHQGGRDHQVTRLAVDVACHAAWNLPRFSATTHSLNGLLVSIFCSSRSFRAALLTLLLLTPRLASAQQQLGHKVLGGIGINAGVQSEPGFFILDRFLSFNAGTLKDRDGNVVPVPGLDVEARANMFGLGLTVKPKHAPYLSIAAGFPVARIAINSDLPLGAIDRSGLGDAYVQPLKVGLRESHFDAVASYSFYVPTGEYEPRRPSVGRGFWTHQFSLGGAVYPKKDRRWRASVLGSYDLNGWKRDIDIKRGNTIQLQGGAGMAVAKFAMIGVSGFSLWQVTDDKGADVPPVLRGLRTRGYGIGPELSFVLKQRLFGELRYEWEVGARSRLEGGVLAAGLSYTLWQPKSGKPAAADR